MDKQEEMEANEVPGVSGTLVHEMFEASKP